MKDHRLQTYKFEVYHGRPEKTDNRLLLLEPRIGPDDRVGYFVRNVFHGSRNEIVNAFAACLKELMPDPEEYFQTHSLPQYVKQYFGTNQIVMKRASDKGFEEEGFTFEGPMLSILIVKKHAHAAREELKRVIRQKLQDQ